MDDKKEYLFAVISEINDYPKSLILTHLNFAQLMEDVVIPYQNDKPFFVDGVPVTRKKIKKIKIIGQMEFFKNTFSELHHTMRRGELDKQKIYAEQYNVRLEALLRESGEDVTSQIIKAYDLSVKPKLTKYLPNRKELYDAALNLFIEGLKLFGSKYI
jgi:hypothetical protein